MNGATYAVNKFIPPSAGTYKITATKGSSSSGEVTVTANPAPASPFTQKVLAEDYTGTWCGHCPRVGIQLENYSATHPNLVVVGVHGPNGSGDPYIYQYVSQLTGFFNITGWPSVIINRDAKWNENTAVLDQAATKRAPLGLALETTIAGSTINVKAKVKYDVNTDIPMKLVVLLTEDGLVHPQTNYGYYGLPDPITNYTHNHTLRTAATDIFGDAIPTASQTKGNTWEKNLSFNATGYNMAKLKVIAFVIYDTNGYSRKGALNVQIVSAGQTKAFD